MIWYLELLVWNLKFGTFILEFWSLGYRVRFFDMRFGVWSFWLKILSLEYLVCIFQFRVWNFVV